MFCAFLKIISKLDRSFLSLSLLAVSLSAFLYVVGCKPNNGWLIFDSHFQNCIHLALEAVNDMNGLPQNAALRKLSSCPLKFLSSYELSTVCGQMHPSPFSLLLIRFQVETVLFEINAQKLTIPPCPSH